MNTIDPASKKLIPHRRDSEPVALDKADRITPTGERKPRQQKQSSDNKKSQKQSSLADEKPTVNERLEAITYDKKGKSSAKNRLNLSV